MLLLKRFLTNLSVFYRECFAISLDHNLLLPGWNDLFYRWLPLSVCFYLFVSLKKQRKSIDSRNEFSVKTTAATAATSAIVPVTTSAPSSIGSSSGSSTCRRRRQRRQKRRQRRQRRQHQREQQQHNRSHKQVQQPRTTTSWTVFAFKVLPLRTLSRLWGWLADQTVPYHFRPIVFGLYSLCFGVKIHEAKDSNLCSYRSLCEFFARQLKDNIRPLDGGFLVSPADGTIVHFGRITSDFIEQVKGVTYSLCDFLGETCFDYHRTNRLFHCVIYLAPGDYHRFHSPANWKPNVRKHFNGHLFSVNPKMVSWFSGLFCLNERVLYAGTWLFGYFAYTLVGATNVGKINVYFDANLQTNKMTHRYSKTREETFANLELAKGDLIGEFRMGSTIVLIFEAPENFRFSVNVGDKVRVGQSIGYLMADETAAATSSDTVAATAASGNSSAGIAETLPSSEIASCSSTTPSANNRSLLDKIYCKISIIRARNSFNVLSP